MEQRFFTHLNFCFQTRLESKFDLSFPLIGFILLFFMHSTLANAHNHSAKVDSPNSMAMSINVSEPWARATFALAKTGAAYFSVSNMGNTAVVLESVSLQADIAMTAELHHTMMQNDMMHMQELSEGVKINSGESVDFSPGGKHIMIMGLEGPLQKGKSIVITLHFADGSSKGQVFPILDKRN
jgi:copper(I)-binding protein